MTKVSLKEILTKLLDNKSMIDRFYPVGSYYETSDTTFNPNVSWGGTWVLESEGQVHVSAGSTYTAGSSYGSNTHTHTTGDLKLTDAHIAHGHSFTNPSYKATGGAVTNRAAFNTGKMSANATHTHTYGNYTTASPTGGNVGVWWIGSGAVSGVAVGGISTTSTEHTHSVPEHGHGFTQPTISVNTNGSVGNLGTPANRTAHNHGATGSSTRNSWQPSVAVNRWHRTA